MKADLVPDALLRQFLLAQVDEEERQRIERLFITGELSKERVLAIEEELIDDYLDDYLSEEDKESFLSQYGDTPKQQQQLKVAGSIRDWARAAQSNTEVSQKSGWGGLRQWIQLSPFGVSLSR